MSILKQITKIGISTEQLANLTNADIIRIEKRLKAQMRMDSNIDINSVGQLLNVLKNNKNELQVLFSDAFIKLREILINPTKIVAFDPKKFTEIDVTDDFLDFIGTNFQIELKAYANFCIKENNYYGLWLFLHYRFVFNSILIDEIANRIHQKFNLFIESIFIKSERIESKILPTLNPYFYRCLNQLGSVLFEREIHDLVKISMSHLSNEALTLRLFFAMGSFNAINANMKEVIRSNKLLAYNSGVREVTNPENTALGKGGSGFNKKIIREKSNKSTFGVIGAIGFIIYIVIKLTVIGDWHSSTPTFESSNKYAVTQLYDRLNMNNNEAEMDQIESDFMATVNYLHSDLVEITDRHKVPFNIDSIHLFIEKDTYELALRTVELTNETNQTMVVFTRLEKIEEGDFYCVDPGETIKISKRTDGIRIYSGKEPEMVEYIDEFGEIKEHFRFNTITGNNNPDFLELHTFSTPLELRVGCNVTISSFGESAFKVEASDLYE